MNIKQCKTKVGIFCIFHFVRIISKNYQNGMVLLFPLRTEHADCNIDNYFNWHRDDTER